VILDRTGLLLRVELDNLHALRKFGLEAIAMTSNGLALHRRLPGLVESGLTHLNLRYTGLLSETDEI
jgi:molybdenum cofactor biosynthesis enzyme MoaA